MAVSADDIRIKVFLESLFDDKGSKRFRKDLKGTKKDATLLGASLKSVGALAAGAFTVAGISKFVGFLSKAADESARLEKGLLEVGTLMGGLTKGEISAMRAELHDLAVESGQAVETLVKAKYDVVSAGFSDAADSALILNKSARLAGGGVTDVATSADLLTTILNAYQKEAKDAGEVSDDLFTIVKNGKTNMNELGSQMGQVIAIAGPLGVELDEVGAAISTLTAQGQSTAIATTAISAAVSELSKPSKELQAALAAVGIQSDNLIKSGGGLAGALDLVKKASDGTGVSVDKLVSREEALRAILPLVSTAAGKFAKDLKSMDDNAGEADKAFEQMADGSDHLKKQVTAAFESARDAVGEAITSNEDYKKLLGQVKGAVGEFTQKLRDGDEDFDKFVSNLAQMGSNAVSAATDITTELIPALSEVVGVLNMLFAFQVSPEGKALRAFAVENALGGGLNFVGGVISGYEAYNEAKEKQEPKARKASGIKSPFRGDSQIAALMGYTPEKIDAQFRKSAKEADEAVAKAIARAVEAAEEQKKLGNAAGNTTGKVEGLGSATGDAERKQREAAQALEDAEQWYRREYEAVKGLADAEDAHAEKIKHLTTYFENGRISLDEFRKRVIDADDALAKFSVDAGKQPTPGSVSEAQEYHVLGSTFVGTEEDRDAVAEALQKADEQVEALYMIGDSLDVMGYDLRGAGNFASAIEQLTLASKLGEIPGADPTNAQVRAIGNLLMGVGANIGGDVGDTIASTAGMALAGLEIAGGNPVGAVIGGVVGLVGSIIGGGDKEEQGREAREQTRRQVYDRIVQSALSGGTFSAELLAAGDYTYRGVANLPDPGYPGHDSTYGRLLKDRSQEEMPELLEFIAAMDEIGVAMDAVTKTSLASTLDQLAIKYEYLATQVEGYIDTLEAQQTEIASAVLGITADSMMTMFDAAIDTAEDADHAGRMIAESLEMQIVESFKKMAISQAINEAVMPMLQPVLNELVAGALSGGLSPGEMADLVLQAQEVAASVAPAVSALYGAFDEAGVMEASSYAGSSYNAETPAAIEFRENGGPVVAGQPYIVGERRPELFTPGSDGYITPFVPTAADMSQVVAELRALRNEQQSVIVTIDGQQFRAFLDKKRVKAEKRIAAGLSRTLRQEF